MRFGKNGRVSIEMTLFGAKKETLNENQQPKRKRATKENCVSGYWFLVCIEYILNQVPIRIAHTHRFYIQKGIFVEKKFVSIPFKTKFSFLFSHTHSSSLIPSQK